MDHKKRLLAEQLRLISALIESVENKVLGQEELENQLVESTVDIGKKANPMFTEQGMDDIVKIIILEEKLAGNIAEA